MSYALAHEEEHSTKPTDLHDIAMNMSEPVPHIMHHAHGVPILQTDLKPAERKWWESYDPETFFTVQSAHQTALWIHVTFGLLTIFFVYPIALVLKNVGSSWYMIVLTVHTGMVMVSLFNYSIFINSVPDLYPGNAYGPMLGILFLLCVTHYIAALFHFGSRYLKQNAKELPGDESVPLYSLDSPTDPSVPISSTSGGYFARLYQSSFFQQVSQSVVGVAQTVFNILHWLNFFYFLIILPVAVAVMGEFGKGRTVFNLLAHFIKGGIFFAYGLLTLARHSGGFANKGWAWNHKFIHRVASKADAYQPQGTFTMEFIESALITFYGCTNIFMEHLAGAGGAWTAKDLQHASIAFIYIGCGLGGLICEAKLSSWRHQRALTDAATMERAKNVDANAVKASPGYSPNPFPVLTIFWTGVLMSKHAQASQLSTNIHALWGKLFMYGCMFRGATYLLMMLLPKTSSLTKPTRPFTELLTAFCLILGGLIFMESTEPVILAFEWHGWTEMFVLNVSLGAVALLMAWEMALFAFKDWLLARQRRASGCTAGSQWLEPDMS